MDGQACVLSLVGGCDSGRMGPYHFNPFAHIGAAAARARQQKREEGKASSATTSATSVAPMLALPSELFYGQLVPFLGQKELTRLHATCKVCWFGASGAGGSWTRW